MTTWGFRLVLAVLSIVLLAALGSAQSPVDPKSLIGDWVGDTHDLVAELTVDGTSMKGTGTRTRTAPSGSSISGA